jgi:hypothetical protein
MAVTQKMYLGDILLNKTFLGDTGAVTRGVPRLEIEYLIVAGGGAGELDNTENEIGTLFGGGGGAGGLLTGAVILAQSDTLSATIGAGGVYSNQGASTNGSNTSLIGSKLSITTTGGGAGGLNKGGGTTHIGKNGGSGGGAGRDGGAFASGGTGISGQGNNGGSSAGAPSNVAGGGGGAGGAGGKGTAGGGVSWLDSITYARGGYNNTPQTINTGNGGNRKFVNVTNEFANGNSGVVKIRYEGTPKATGGIITQSGGFTFHTFTSAGTFTVSF